jgi:hypothetical protein
MSQPVFYRVSDAPVRDLTDEALHVECSDIKREMVSLELRMGEKEAWRLVETPADDYYAWRARTKGFYSMLMKRYLVVLPEIKRRQRRKVNHV